MKSKEEILEQAERHLQENIGACMGQQEEGLVIHSFVLGANWAQEQDNWIQCHHKNVLPEGNYNLLLKIKTIETIRLFRAGKGGNEIPYFHAIAYNKIPSIK